MSERAGAANPWIVRPAPRPRARLRLICFPYAGGGAALYRGWPDGLPAHIDVCSIRLPGRETRLVEPAFDRMGHLIDALAAALRPVADLPFALFGHSMGALVAFEYARRLRRDRAAGPVHLFAAGHRAPQRSRTKSPVHHLPDREFLEYLRKSGGTPADLLANAEFMSLLLPTLRADFALCETYAYLPEPPLDCPITAFGGDRDADVSAESLAAWESQTSDVFAQRILPGDHFFLHEQRPAILAQIATAVSRSLG